jgi:hypothetical protein
MKFRMFTFLTAATLFGVLPTRWSTFLKAHWECLTATDFMSVEVCTIKGLVTQYILFFIDLPSRSVHVAGISRYLDNSWMTQIARNITDVDDSFLRLINLDSCSRFPDITAAQ